MIFVRKGELISALAIFIFAVSFNAAADSLSAEDLEAVIRLNPSMHFAKWAIRQPIDENYAALTFQEVGDHSQLERAGRRYALTILHVPSRKVLLTLERGTLELGINPHPIEAAKDRAVFGFGTDYVDQRRVEYTFSLNPPKILGSKDIEPPQADPDTP